MGQRKHTIVKTRTYLDDGYPEIAVTTNSGRTWTFRFASGKTHLMSTGLRAADHKSEYKVAREHADNRLRFVYLDVREGKPVKQDDYGTLFDMSELDGTPGDPPLSLAAFLAINSEENGCTPPDPSEVDELRACPVGGKVNLGIGGGFVTVTRVS